MSYQRNQHPTLRALFDLKLTYQTGLCSLHLDLSSGTVRATWSPSPIVRRSQRTSWRGTAGGNCTKTQNAKAHQEKYLYPARSLNEFRRTVGSRAPNHPDYTKRLLTQDKLGHCSPESCPEWFQWDRCRTSSTLGGPQAWCTRGTGAKKSNVKRILFMTTWSTRTKSGVLIRRQGNSIISWGSILVPSWQVDSKSKTK